MKMILASFLVVGLAGFGVAYYAAHVAFVPPPSVPSAKLEQPAAAVRVERDEPCRSIVASGTVKPEEVVEVGTQVNGMIASFGTDPANPSKPIDYGSVVRKGTVLAQIDPAIYTAQVDYAEASLMRANADLLQLQAKCEQSKHEWLRAQSLLPEKAIAGTEYDLALANFQVATANVTVGKAVVQQCEATLRVARTNRAYTVIKSPIDGVVIDRRVNVGQTVIASFNAPGLFLIAKDLQRVQVWASVNETDIARIRLGLPVRFTVDAYPGDVFDGKVSQVRLSPTRAGNNTTYTVVVAPDNCRGMLPFLTAKLRFQTESYASRLPVSNDPLPTTPAPVKKKGEVVASR